MLLLPLLNVLAALGFFKVGVSSGREINEVVGREPVVIGGMVLDIHAIPSVSPQPRTTTPGKVRYLLGGVGRNIAECMAKLGTRPYMISAVGIDFAGISSYLLSILMFMLVLLMLWLLTYCNVGVQLLYHDVNYSDFLISISSLHCCNVWIVLSVYYVLLFINLLCIITGKLLLENWKSAGLSTEGIRKHQDIDTAVISNIFDTDGELAAAVASVDAIEKFLTPAWIQQCQTVIRCAPILVVDANLSPIALEASCKVAAEFDRPVWFEPVSVAKSTRITYIAKYVTFASPNEDELMSMANALSGKSSFHSVKTNDYNQDPRKSLFDTLKPAITVLLNRGIKIVAVTVGEDGLFLCSNNPDFLTYRLQTTVGNNRNGKCLYDAVTSACPPEKPYTFAMKTEGTSQLFAVHFPAVTASVVRLTGAGDCMVGGTVASLSSGLDIVQSIGVGIAMAKAAIEAETNVPSVVSLADVAGISKLACSAATCL
ncbi:Pseudouridine kinase [Linum perenne]